jgi:hypothetical protein
MYRSKVIFIKISITFLTKIVKIMLKITGNYERAPQIVKAILVKMEKQGAITLPNF